MAEYKFQPDPFTIKACSKKELRIALGVSKHVFNKWLKAVEHEIGLPVCGLYSAKQVQMIIEKFGLPGYLIRE